MITRRSFITSLLAGVMAVSCMGLAACGSGTGEPKAVTPKVEGALWDNPGIYTYTNDDPDSPFQTFKITVDKDISIDMDEFTTDHAYTMTKRYMSVDPAENPGLFGEDTDGAETKPAQLEMGDGGRWSSNYETGDLRYRAEIQFKIPRDDGTRREGTLYINGPLNDPAEETDFTHLSLETCVLAISGVNYVDPAYVESLSYNGLDTDFNGGAVSNSFVSSKLTETTEPIHFTLTNYEVNQ